jgi:hypothetical protein
MRSRRGYVGAVGIMSVAALVACSSTQHATTPVASGAAGATSAKPSTPVSLPARGVELQSDQIPWDEVGLGWTLAAWSAAPTPGIPPPDGQSTMAPLTLYLLDPAGGRYPATTIPVIPGVRPGDPGHNPWLVDWSGDGARALFQDSGQAPDGSQYTTLTNIELETGAKQTFSLGTGSYWVHYSRPDGQAILVETDDKSGQPSGLERFDLSGAKQLTYPTDKLAQAGTFDGGYLESPDGTQLVLGTSNGLVLMGNDGALGQALPITGPVTMCFPIRWWTATEVLASCRDGSQASQASQLRTVPVDGTAGAALTAVYTGYEDHFEGNAWQLPSGTFLHSETGCGSGFLSRLTPDGHSTKVAIPGVTNMHEFDVVGTVDDALVIRASLGCEGGSSLLTYAPANDTTTVLLGPGVNGGDVQGTVLFPTP